MMRREKKGVAGIIAGIFLAAILFSSVFVFFLVMTEGQTTRTKAEIEAQDYKNDKLQELFKVRSEDNLAELDANNQGYIKIGVNNTGGIPMAVSYLMVYNQNDIPMLEGTPFIFGSPFTINGGFKAMINTKDIDSSVRFDKDPVKPYRIDIISERGNIQSTTYPPPPLIEFNLNLNITSPFAQSAAEAALAQQTGSIILNYTGFGALFPNFASGGSVDQRGWDANVQDTPGYPAFRLIDSQLTYLTARIKNKDFSGEDIDLLHHTAFVITRDQGTSFSQQALYICNADYINKTVSQYDDANPETLVNVRDSTNPNEGWTNITLCDTAIGTTGPNAFKNDWTPVDSNVNFLFMIVRGNFANGRPYAQTIPYQAVLIPDQTFTASVTNPATYEGQTNSTLTVAISGGTAPFDIHWVYPDGRYDLRGTITGTSTNIDVPTDAPLGYNIIQVTDAVERVYYMTFEVIP
jgi:hypothetical protein